MPNYNLGTARGRITLDASGAVKGGAEAEAAATKATSKMGAAGRGAVMAGGALTATAGLVAAGFAVAVSSAVSFEKQISAIGAVSGANGKELEALRGKALQLDKDTKFSASEAATAIEELVKAGVSVPDVLNGAADATVALAAAGEIELPQAATIAANAMNAFGLSAQTLPHVADMIAGAANASAIDVTQFGQSLQQVGAVAHLSGLSFDDVSVAIAEMGNAGIKGSDAGTSLKTMLQNLIPVTDKQIALSKKMGLITKDGANAFFDQHGKVKSLAEIQGVLAKATKGMTKEQELAAFSTLFGSDSIRAAAVMAQNGTEGYNKLSASMKKVTAEGVAQQRMNNLAGQWEQLKGSLETVGITIGTMLLPALRRLTEMGTALLNWFLNLSPGMQKTIVMFVAITAAVIGFVGIVVTIAGAIAIAMAALAPFAAILGIGAAALLGWIAIIPIIIAAVVLLVIVIVKNWTTIKNFTIAVFSAIAGFFVSIWQTIVNAVTTAASAVWSVITTIFNAIKFVIMAVFTAITAVITFYINIWLTIIRTVLGVIMAIWTAFWNTFGGLVKAVLALIVAIVQLYFALMRFAILTALAAIQAVFTFVFNVIKSIVLAALSFIVAIVRTYINIARAVISTTLNAIRFLFVSIFNGILAVVRAVWSVIGGVVMAGVARVWAGIRTLAGIAATVAGYFGRLVSGVAGKIASLVSTCAGIAGKVLSAIGNLGSLLYDAGVSIIQGLIDGITHMIGKLTGVLNGITKLIPKKKGPRSVDMHLLQESGELIMGGLINGIESQVSPLIRSLHGVTSTIPKQVALQVNTSRGTVTASAPTQTGPLLAEGAVQVHAPQTMSPAEVGRQVATRVGAAVLGGSVPPNTGVGR